MTLQGAIQQLHDLRSDGNFPCYYKPSIDKVIETLQMDAQEVRRGRWEHYEHREPQYDIEGYKTWAEAYKCSNCGFIHTVIEDFGHYAFCPRCGADMREAKNGCDDCFIPMFYNLEDDDSICRDCEVEE